MQFCMYDLEYIGKTTQIILLHNKCKWLSDTLWHYFEYQNVFLLCMEVMIVLLVSFYAVSKTTLFQNISLVTLRVILVF